jgi:lipopolysaccharide transport system ATP-binding protein
MDNNTVIKVEGLSKKFCYDLKCSLVYGLHDVTKSMLGIYNDCSILRKMEFWALNDINFELKKGEALGLIGQNGSGKTTLLRIISGIFPPDKGRISIQGVIGALISVGAGFHPHMTGRENIYLNGTILGMKKKEIKEKIDSIINFADIGNFIDSPVSTYSSGMIVRLGFSIAIHSSPEILLADEILAVGDLQFSLKCLRKFNDYIKGGGSLIFVSHNLLLIRNLCTSVLWIDKGERIDYGEVRPICDKYEKFMMEKDNKNTAKDININGSILNYDPDIRIEKVEFLDKYGNLRDIFFNGEELKARIHYKCRRKIRNPIFRFIIVNSEDITIMGRYSNEDGFNVKYLNKEGFIDIITGKISFRSGNYRCSVMIAENNPLNVLEWHEKRYLFQVISKVETYNQGILQIPVKWEKGNI